MRTNPLSSSNRRAAGFTLVELMIAVAIASILAAVAIPSYQSYVRRGQLSEAFATLSDMRVKMEQYYQDNKFYGQALNNSTCTSLSGYGAFPVSTKYFSFKCDAGAAPSQTYTLTAEGKAGGLTSGYDYTLNQAGTKGTVKFANAASTAACWLTKPSACDN